MWNTLHSESCRQPASAKLLEMPLPVSRLRRWFAVGAILMVVIVAGMYVYARWRVRNAYIRYMTARFAWYETRSQLVFSRAAER